MSDIGLYKDPDEVIREAEQRDAEIEKNMEPDQERGQGVDDQDPPGEDDGDESPDEATPEP